MEGISERWYSASSGRKAGFVVAILMILALLAGGTYWVMREDYQVLFADLSGQDAATIVAELERMKMPYRLGDGGATVMVQSEEVHRTRLKLMGNGIDLHGAVGLEIFNDADFGMTDFAQKVNYQRAMQGELVRTISSLKEVRTARVHLVLPETGLFKKKDETAKASITVTTRRGGALSADQISGIQRLVAAAVPQIDPANVTIVDQSGVALTRPVETDPISAAPSGRLDVKKQVEAYVTRKIVEVLDRAVGPGQAIVSVDAALDYSQTRVTTEDVVPLPDTSGQSVGAVSRRRESVQGDPIGAVVNAAAGVGGRPSASRSTEVDFLNGRRVSQIVSAPGSVRRLSVGVMLPGVTDPVAVEKIREVVSMAAGLDNGRGDVIAVYSIDLPTAQAEGTKESVVVAVEAAGAEAEVAPERRSVLGGDAQDATRQYGWLAIAVLLLLLLVGKMVRARRAPVAAAMSREERDRLLEEISAWAAECRAERA